MRGDGERTRQQTCVESIWQLQSICIYLSSGGKDPDPHRASAPGPRWGLPFLRPHVLTLTLKPGYAAAMQYKYRERNGVVEERAAANHGASGRAS